MGPRVSSTGEVFQVVQFSGGGYFEPPVGLEVKLWCSDVVSGGVFFQVVRLIIR